jgi:AmiR/NasT family two-component response regulator
MYRALLATEAPWSADELRDDLADAGVDVVAESEGASDLATAAVRNAADLVVAASASPSTLMFEAARMLGSLAPCPFVLFTADRDHAKIEQASASGVHAYVIDGYAKHRLLSIIQVARARFRHEQLMKEELVGLSLRFEERKLVDRAKGMLMRSRGITEDEAFEMLRSLAMRARQRIGVVAQSVSDLSRAGEAVNRAGQLRMLSQRLVLCYAQALSGHAPERAVQIIGDCIGRVEANLGILHRAISTKGYGERVERVTRSWESVRPICEQSPHADRLATLDTRSEEMLTDAESLTDFLETSGLVGSLHVINVAGRQRMLGQRIAKLCFMVALEPTAPRLAELNTLSTSFQAALDFLQKLPLWSPTIASNLEKSVLEWQRLKDTLGDMSSAAALPRVANASERLLEASERLTDQYEQAMQTLIGDRTGRMR